MASPSSIEPRTMAFPAALHFWFHPEVERCRALGIEIPDEYAVAMGGSYMSKIHRCCGFPDSTFDVVGGKNLHRFFFRGSS